MANFPEHLLKEYKPIIKRKTPSKDISYKIRVVERKLEGIFRVLLDIREYWITDKRFGLTEKGVYFNREELEYLIDILLEAKKEFFSATYSRDRDKDPSDHQS